MICGWRGYLNSRPQLFLKSRLRPRKHMTDWQNVYGCSIIVFFFYHPVKARLIVNVHEMSCGSLLKILCSGNRHLCLYALLNISTTVSLSEPTCTRVSRSSLSAVSEVSVGVYIWANVRGQINITGSVTDRLYNFHLNKNTWRFILCCKAPTLTQL